MNLIDGKKIAAELRNELKVEVDGIKKKFNKVPGLTVILIGELAPSKIYVKNKEKFAKEVGINSDVLRYPADLKEEELLNKIEELNKDDALVTFKEFQVLDNKVDELILLQKEIAANLLEMNRVRQVAAKKKKVTPKVAPKPKPNPLKFP